MIKNSLSKYRQYVEALILSSSVALILLLGQVAHVPNAHAMYSCEPAPSNLASWWSGDVSSEDIAGNNDGAISGGITTVPGLVDNAFHSDGFDGIIDVDHDPTLNIPAMQDFTFEVWIKLVNPTSGHDDWIVSKFDTQNIRLGVTNNFFSVYVNRDDHVIRFDLGSNDVVYPLAGSSIPLDSWTHLAVVREGNIGLIYINGVLDASAVLTDGSLVNTDSLSIGGVKDTLFTPPLELNHSFGGMIDELSFYNRALSSSEIQAIHDASVNGKCKEVPVCNGMPATVYVNEADIIVGGPDNGELYSGFLRGTPGDDVLMGTINVDEIRGRGGNDLICAGQGADLVLGGNGADTIYGEGGADTIRAGSGADTVNGGVDNDDIRGNNGNDILNGDGNNDTIRGGRGDDIVNGNAGDDALWGNANVDICNGDTGIDTAAGNCETIIDVP